MREVERDTCDLEFLRKYCSVRWHALTCVFSFIVFFGPMFTLVSEKKKKKDKGSEGESGDISDLGYYY